MLLYNFPFIDGWLLNVVTFWTWWSYVWSKCLKIFSCILFIPINNFDFRLKACMIVTMIVVLWEQPLMAMAWIEECQECHLVAIIYHHPHVLEQLCVTKIMYSHAVHHCPAVVHRKYWKNNMLHIFST
jgi:hypothetical protein